MCNCKFPIKTTKVTYLHLALNRWRETPQYNDRHVCILRHSSHSDLNFFILVLLFSTQNLKSVHFIKAAQQTTCTPVLVTIYTYPSVGVTVIRLPHTTSVTPLNQGFLFPSMIEMNCSPATYDSASKTKPMDTGKRVKLTQTPIWYTVLAICPASGSVSELLWVCFINQSSLLLVKRWDRKRTTLEACSKYRYLSPGKLSHTITGTCSHLGIFSLTAIKTQIFLCRKTVSHHNSGTCSHLGIFNSNVKFSPNQCVLSGCSQQYWAYSHLFKPLWNFAWANPTTFATKKQKLG